MELRLFIPDTPRRAWQAARYWLGIRRSPVHIYGIEDMRAEHRKTLDLKMRLNEAENKIAAQRTKIAGISRELSELKRKTNNQEANNPATGLDL